MSIQKIGFEDIFNDLAFNLYYLNLFCYYQIDDIYTEKAFNIVEKVRFLVVRRTLGKGRIYKIISLIKKVILEKIGVESVQKRNFYKSEFKISLVFRTYYCCKNNKSVTKITIVTDILFVAMIMISYK